MSDGSRSSHGTVTRGETVTLTANEPKNEAWKFKEWLIHGADIDTRKSTAKGVTGGQSRCHISVTGDGSV